uniref:Uncharacterized protein n=1 Tax=Glossina pallidipes TaxID=7398 RepID=A0A1A9ZHR6_GLOPL
MKADESDKWNFGNQKPCVIYIMKVRKNFELTLKKKIRRETLTDVSDLIDQFNADVIGSLAFGFSYDFVKNIAFRVFALKYINIKRRPYLLNIRMSNSLLLNAGIDVYNLCNNSHIDNGVDVRSTSIVSVSDKIR